VSLSWIVVFPRVVVRLLHMYSRQEREEIFDAYLRHQRTYERMSHKEDISLGIFAWMSPGGA
jgi:hypothetical protein